MNTRQTILAAVAILLFVALGVWWYLGFSLDFMRFFAAEPGVDTSTDRLCNAPPGCTCQVVQCIQAPCDPIITCPSCQPRPACLDAVPSCEIAEPAEGWCPSPGGRIVSCAPSTQTVAVGAGAQLSAAGGGGTYQWFAPDGVIATNDVIGTARTGTFMVAYQTVGTKKVTVQSARGDGSKNVDSVACTVIVTDTTQRQ